MNLNSNKQIILIRRLGKAFIHLFIQQPVTKCHCTKLHADSKDTKMNNI